ncbi:MAG: MarR family transcriptional regulator [Tepidiformaceae bacterium]
MSTVAAKRLLPAAASAERRLTRTGPGVGPLPPSVTRNALLAGGSDERFRQIVHDLMLISDAVRIVRSHFGSLLGVSGPQYVLLMAVARGQSDEGMSASQVAEYLRVSNAFVTIASRVLIERGLLKKRSHPDDGRSVLLQLSARGRRAIEAIAPRMQSINDRFFAGLTHTSFDHAEQILTSLADGARDALDRIDELN